MIKAARERQGLTVTQLSVKANVLGWDIVQMEQGRWVNSAARQNVLKALGLTDEPNAEGAEIS
jgi:ribosome-binding protein aMBF1 (putative translation factor)